jgi:hypothetical protein
LCACLAVTTLLFADPALAFRCGNKLVKEGMHEQEVIAICGAPESIQHLGYAIRSIDYHSRSTGGWNTSHFPGYGAYAAEVRLTEYIYNFGPRKFMQRLVFEAGVLAEIQKLGRGHSE